MGKRPERIFRGPVKQDLFCKICNEVFLDPHTINCGTKKSHCPICWVYLQTTQQKVNQYLARRIDKLTTECPYGNCNWKGPYSKIKAHKIDCKLKPRKQPQHVDPKKFIDLEGPEFDSKFIFQQYQNVRRAEGQEMYTSQQSEKQSSKKSSNNIGLQQEANIFSVKFYIPPQLFGPRPGMQAIDL